MHVVNRLSRRNQPKVSCMGNGNWFYPFSKYVLFNIYKNYYGKKIFANKVIFNMYIIIWGLYGVVYMFDETTKNICLNILDLTAKCIIGLGLWVYYTHIIQP